MNATIATTFAIVQPLVAMGSLIAVALAIGGFAYRRGDTQLGSRGTGVAIRAGVLLAAPHCGSPNASISALAGVAI